MKPQKRTQRLDKALVEAKAAAKGQVGVDKRFTSLKTATPDGGAIEGVQQGLYRPDEQQLEAINRFTLSPKTADEVVCFDTLSCNDLMDRDDDRFDTDTVEAFAALGEPYGPIGKAFMVSHDYETLPVGRIFDADSLKVPEAENATFLKNSVYIPDTDQYKDFLENQEFGIYWAVSVGVMLEEMQCGLTFCDAGMYRSMFGGGAWCANGHDKGYWYTKDAETDSWGYPIPSEQGEKGAEFCYGLMKGAKDFFELSQCFLGAQFYASLAKRAGGIVKAASARGSVPIVGLSSKEATKIPLQHVPDRLREAVAGNQITERSADGSYQWTDGEGLIWTYEPGNEVLCLGKTAPEGEDSSDEDDESADDTADDTTDDTADGGDEGDGEEDDADGESDTVGESDDESLGEGSEVDSEPAAGAVGEQDGADGTGSDGSEDLEGEDGDLTEDDDEEDDSSDSDNVDLSARLASLRSQVETLTADEEGDHADLAEAITSVLDEAQAALDAEDNDEAESLITSAESTVGEFVDAGADNSSTSTAEGEDTLSKKAVLAAATKARVPATIIRQVKEAEGTGLDVLLRAVSEQNASLTAQVSDLTPKAALGDEYIKDVRADAVDWYVKAHQEKDKPAVSVVNFEKILDACGDNVTLVRTLRDEQKGLAQAKFPKSVRRSTTPTDPNEATGPGEIGGVEAKPDDANVKRVRRLHG